MRNIVRNIWYFVYAVYLNLTGRHVRISGSAHLRLTDAGIGKCVKISEKSYLNGSIGDYSYIGARSQIYGEIGKFCSIGNDVKVVPATHPVTHVSTSPAFYSNAGQTVRSFVSKGTFEDRLFVPGTQSACVVGNDVWIGDNVLVKGGIRISDGAVVAMGAVVTEDVPPYAVVGGCPAKIIKFRFSQSEIERLLQSEWWNKSERWLSDHACDFADIDVFLSRIEE